MRLGRFSGQTLAASPYEPLQEGSGVTRIVLDLHDGIDYPKTLRGAAQHTGAACILRNLADQIEAQTRPPKPDEPMGLGTVVEDAEGHRWVRLHSGDGVPWCGGLNKHREYAAIDAVRVLSVGVQQ